MKNYLFLVFYFLSICPMLSFSNGCMSDWGYSFCIESVSFDSNNSGYIDVRKDDDDTRSDVYMAPHFEQSFAGGCQRMAFGEPRLGNVLVRNPVCYSSGSTASISAEMSTSCPNSFWVKGTATTNDGKIFEFPSEFVQPSPLGMASYPINSCLQSFETGVVRAYEQFSIVWEVSENDSDWHIVDVSTNPVYIIKEFEENLPNYVGPWQWSAIHLSCTAGNGQSDDQIIIEGIGALLDNGDVKRVDGHILSYWLTSYLCSGGEYLITGGNGQCQAWADLMGLLGAVQGIYDFDLIRVDPYLDANNPMDGDEILQYLHDDGYGLTLGDLEIVHIRLMAVKNWGNDEVYYIGDASSNWTSVIPLLRSDPMGDIGVEGQGNPNPRSIFEAHVIYKSLLNGKYYDASYPGAKSGGSNIYNTDELWEDNSLHATRAFVFSETTDSDGNTHDPPRIHIFMKRQNTIGKECRFTKIN